MSRTITISDEDEATIRDFLAHHLQHLRVRAVLALLDAAPPTHSAACPNAAETCSPTCATWEGRACDCKAAEPAEDLGAACCGSCGEHYPASEMVLEEDGTHADKCAKCDEEGCMGATFNGAVALEVWEATLDSQLACDVGQMACEVERLKRAILAARGKVAT